MPLAPPRLYPRGGFTWDVQFRLTSPAPADGFIIQEIRNRDFSGGLAEHYWEAWPVARGAVGTGATTRDDEFFISEGARRSRGSSYVIGTVRFYTGPLPSSFRTHHPKIMSTSQLASTAPPPCWTGDGTPHTVRSYWDDRPGHRRWNYLTARWGSRRLRVP